MRRFLTTALAALTVTACAPGPVPHAGALPADQMVFTVTASGGMVPAVIYAMESPSLVVYGDGRVLSAVPDQSARAVPVRYEVARVDPSVVGDFVDSALSGGLFDGNTDFGSPRVTDLATTTVTVAGEGGPARVQSVQAYAFAEQFDDDLTVSQRDARVRLRALIEKARALAAGAPRSPYVPDRVVIYEVDARYPDDPAEIGWPGPPPASFLTPTDQRRALACGELNADPAEQVYQAALANPGARWLVDGATRVLAVNSLPMPGDCP